MEIVFTRQNFQTYTTQVTRDDKVILTVPAYDRPDWIPHDIAHLIVEQKLGLAQGFWGRIAAGAVYPGMTIVSGRQRPHAAQRSNLAVKSAPEQGTQSEVLVGIFCKLAYEKLDLNWPVAQSLLKNIGRNNSQARYAWQPTEVKLICQALREAHTDWQLLAVGQTLTYRW